MADEEVSEKGEGEEIPRDSVREEYFAPAESHDPYLKLERRRRLIAKITSSLAIVLSMVAAVGGALGLFSSGLNRSAKLEIQTIESRETLAMLQKQIKDLDAKVAFVERRLKQVPLSPQAFEPSASNREVVLEIGELQKRVDGLGAVILDNPEKALTTVMLRRELQELKAANEGTAVTVSREVDRVYDLTKWLFGLFLTLALGILTLIATVALKSGRKSE
jgi:hypothetical protein